MLRGFQFKFWDQAIFLKKSTNFFLFFSRNKMPLPVAFQSLFSKKGDKPYLFSALLAPAKSDEAAEQSGAKDETTPPPFSLASVKKEV